MNSDNAPEQTDLIAFLGQREINFEDMSVRAENRITGFEFDFALEDFIIEQDRSGEEPAVHMQSDGRVNGQPIAFSGDFPIDAPFEAQGNLGDLTFTIEGERQSDTTSGDFDARLVVNTGDTQNLLDLLRLEGSFAANAQAEALLVRRNMLWDMENIDLRLQVATGETAQLTGRFADARLGYDFDLSLLVDFVGANEPPPPAIFIKDIRPRSGEMHVVASEGNIEIERFAVQTNAFDEEIRDIGPFRVASVTRSPAGELKLDGATLVIGPQDRPYLLAQASIDSLLTFEGYRLAGELNLPAQSVLLTLRPEEAKRFGRLTGEMRLQETNGEPYLQLFQLRSQDTDLWHAQISLKSDDLDDLDNVELYANVSAPDGRELLEAMRLDPVDIGFMGYEVSATRRQNEISTEGLFSAGETAIETEMSLRIPGTGPVLRGKIHSEKVQIEDVKNSILAFTQLSRIRSIYSDAKASAQNSDTEGFQPLILPDETQSDLEAVQTEDDLSDFQPLVLPETEPGDESKEDLSDLQPLVVTDYATDLAIKDVLNPQQFARLIDAEIDFDIARVTGQEGVSSLQSQLQMKSGNLRLGPVKFAYGKGYADVTATMDAIDKPDWLRITGQTGGWDFGNILDTFGANIGAYGILNGRFDLTGQWASAKAFTTSMRGNATIDMRDGRISTGLMELAGLGVLPWLFSKERRQGYTDIVCLKAPLDIADGRITTRQTVLETRRVQLVGSGTIDVRNNSISLVAEPRPVGQPLSRSAWPIEISGSLTSPDIKIAERKTRRALVPLSIAGTRALCVPDISQLQQR